MTRLQVDGVLMQFGMMSDKLQFVAKLRQAKAYRTSNCIITWWCVLAVFRRFRKREFDKVGFAAVADWLAGSGNRAQACDSCDSAYALQRFRIKTIS
jgi:hypothetical protein